MIYVHASGYWPRLVTDRLYKTFDAGQHWTEIDTGLRPSSLITNVAGVNVPSSVPERSYRSRSTFHLTFSNDTGVYQSYNAGASWATAGAIAPVVPTPTLTPLPTPTLTTAAALSLHSLSVVAASPLPSGWAWQQLHPSGTLPAARQTLQWPGTRQMGPIRVWRC